MLRDLNLQKLSIFNNEKPEKLKSEAMKCFLISGNGKKDTSFFSNKNCSTYSCALFLKIYLYLTLKLFWGQGLGIAGSWKP